MAHTFLSYVEGEEEEEEEEDSSSDDAAIDDDDEVDLTRSLTDELCLAPPRAPTAAGLLLSTYFTLCDHASTRPKPHEGWSRHACRKRTVEWSYRSSAARDLCVSVLSANARTSRPAKSRNGELLPSRRLRSLERSFLSRERERERERLFVRSCLSRERERERFFTRSCLSRERERERFFARSCLSRERERERFFTRSCLSRERERERFFARSCLSRERERERPERLVEPMS